MTTTETEITPYTYETTSTRPQSVAELVKDLRDHDTHVATYSVPDECLEELALDKLPPGVAIIGGAARAIAAQVLYQREAPIRDVDLAAIEPMCDSQTLDDAALMELSLEHMPDDTAYGHSMQTEYNAKDYFDTRDFTMNQVLVVNGTIILTDEARTALRDNVIEPTEYELRHDGTLGPRMTIKAFLLQAVFDDWYGKAECRGFKPCRDIRSHYIALGLNKAFQYDGSVPHKYMNELHKQGHISDDELLMTPIDFARHLIENEDADFEFRGSDNAHAVHADDELFADMPDSPYGDAEQAAVTLLQRFGGRLPEGADPESY